MVMFMLKPRFRKLVLGLLCEVGRRHNRGNTRVLLPGQMAGREKRFLNACPRLLLASSEFPFYPRCPDAAQKSDCLDHRLGPWDRAGHRSVVRQTGRGGVSRTTERWPARSH